MANNAFGPTPLQIPNAIAKQKDVVESSVKESGVTSALEKIYKFLGNRSYRRILLCAGAGGVIFAAWYAYYHQFTREDGPIAVPSSLRATYFEDELEIKKREEKVVLHCNSRGYFTPVIAVQPMKLETFLRVAGIPYDISFGNENSNYDTPIMTYGERSAAEFRDCLRILSDKYNVNLEKGVSSSRKTASNLVDISLENQFSWGILIWRWIHDGGNSMRKIQAINLVGDEVVGEVAMKVKAATRFHPIGQLDREDFVKTINQGIHDISAALGKHEFFHGTSPGAVDCHAFAILVQMLWNMPGSPFEQQLKRFTNLLDFIRRMKETYWPDWNNLILKPKEFEEMYNATFRARSPSGDDKFRRRNSARSQISNGRSGLREHDDESSFEQNTDDGAPGKSLEHRRKLSGDRDLRKLGEQESMKLLTRKDGIENENQNGIYQADSPTANQPLGILKTNNNIPSPVGKPRSGFVNASGAQTHFPVQQIIKASEPAISNRMGPLVAPPSERMYVLPNPSEVKQQGAEEKEDSLTHVHRASVKFAHVPSTEYTAQQNFVNGNERIMAQSQIPVRKAPLHPASAAELSNRNAQISSQAGVVEPVNGNDNLDQQKKDVAYVEQLERNEHILQTFATKSNMQNDNNQGTVVQQVLASNNPPQTCNIPNAPPSGSSPPNQIQQGQYQQPMQQLQQPQTFNPISFKHQLFNQPIPANGSSFQPQQQLNQNNGQQAQPQQAQFNGNAIIPAPQQPQQFQFNQNVHSPPPQQSNTNARPQSYNASTPQLQPMYLNPPPPVNSGFNRPLYLNQTVGTQPVQFQPQAQFVNSTEPGLQQQQTQSPQQAQPQQQPQQQQPYNPSMMSQGQFPPKFQNGYIQQQQQPQQGYGFQGGQPTQGPEPSALRNWF